MEKVVPNLKTFRPEEAFISSSIYMYIYSMYTQKKNYILQQKVSRFHDHQAILQSKDQSYLLYKKENVGTFDNNGCISRIFAGD